METIYGPQSLNIFTVWPLQERFVTLIVDALDCYLPINCIEFCSGRQLILPVDHFDLVEA